MLEERYILLSL
jgi:hypothetical protein